MNPAQTQMTVQTVANQRPMTVQATTFQEPVALQASPAKDSPPSSIWTPPLTVEAPSLKRKRKRLPIHFVNYLDDKLKMPARRFRRVSQKPVYS